VKIREFALRLLLKVPWVRQRHEMEQELAASRLQVAMLQQDLATAQQQLLTTQQQLTSARRSSQLLVEPYATWTLRSREYRNRIEKLAPELLPSWKSFGELGQDLTDYYRPTYTEPTGPFIDRIKSAPGGMSGVPFLIDLGIEGFLFRTEALKLYEMAHNARSDILELGTHKGLSTSILAHALHDRKSGALATVELEAAFSQIAADNLQGLPGADRVTFIVADAAEAMDVLIAEKRRFGFIFVDHWHGYDATREAATRIPLLLANGGYVMFHDFFDPSNQDPDHLYGVFQAVLDTIGQDVQFVYSGAAGSSALFHKMPG
jgi:predicted O-methyltransferase YrrM